MGALMCSVAPACAQQAGSVDAHGLRSLVAHSSSHAVYVERAAVQRPDRNVLPNGDDSVADEPPNPALAHAVGCVIAGSVGTGVAAMAGTKNVVNIIAGGHVFPASHLALYTAVVGVIFGTFCAVGQALTPLYLYAVRPSPPPPARRTLEHKVNLDPRFNSAGWIERSAVGLSDPDEDMSLPASWLPRRR